MGRMSHRRLPLANEEGRTTVQLGTARSPGTLGGGGRLGDYPVTVYWIVAVKVVAGVVFAGTATTI